jgi:peroxiredoxin
MKKILLVSLLLGLFVISCSKKDQTRLNTPNTQSQNTTQNIQSTQTYKSFSVKGTIGDIKQNEMVDFTWIENGNEVKLSDNKGKVILLNFWATWCPPCRKELPDLSAISSELKDKKFKMIGVSVDENQQTLEKFLNSNNITYTILHDQTNVVTQYMSATGGGENVIPQSYIIDKNGRIVEVIIGSRSKSEFLGLINKYL